MFRPTKVVDVEFSRPVEDIERLDGFFAVRGLVRLHGKPLGYIDLPIIENRCKGSALRNAALIKYWRDILNILLVNRLGSPLNLEGPDLQDLLELPPPAYDRPTPLVTVAVCTRNRPRDLQICLDSLLYLDYPALDLLVVDNAPANDVTEQLVKEHYPSVRYFREPRPGLDWARNRAIVEAKGEIIAYADDDVVVDAGWVTALTRAFMDNPEVMALTGLVVPHELETRAQLLFEHSGGFGRGCKRQWFRLDKSGNGSWKYHGAGQYGTGANMAYRCSLLEKIGWFDPALDVGTVTNGGGDLEMFFRVLKEGYTLIYEPGAIVRHRHRRDYAQLREQLANNGIGLFSYFVSSALAYPEERLSFIRLGLWWLRRRYISRWLASFRRPDRFPRELILTEFWGCIVGLTRYRRARRAAARIKERFGPVPSYKNKNQRTSPAQPKAIIKNCDAIAVRSVDLSHPLCDLSNVSEYPRTHLLVNCGKYSLGTVDIDNYYQSISVDRLREEIVNSLGIRMLDPGRRRTIDLVKANAVALMSRHYLPADDPAHRPSQSLPADVPVSIVVATLDRPDDLRICLRHLTAQESSRPIEIIVVDNNPASGLVPPVVAEFANVALVSEPRRGLAYARNAGFIASNGEIAVTADDDVTAPTDWLEKLIAPFIRPDVMVVTGNVLPLELETKAQQLFEEYGGLGRGFEPLEANRRWLESFRRRAVPTWELGATANAAFRTSIFSHPQIGLLDEALGPGMAGVGEDTYLFYKVLKADYTLVYEPSAYVWHRHRNTMSSLRHQLYHYSKGHVAYHLTTLFRDHDLLALRRLVIDLPIWRFRQIWRYLKNVSRGRSRYPLSLILVEILGNVAGPWGLWRSRRRVKRQGRSKEYLGVVGQNEPVASGSTVARTQIEENPGSHI